MRPVLVLTRNQVQMARFTKHLAVQRITAVLIWLRRELDDADLTSVAVLMVGASHAFNIIAVSTVIFWND